MMYSSSTVTLVKFILTEAALLTAIVWIALRRAKPDQSLPAGTAMRGVLWLLIGHALLNYYALDPRSFFTSVNVYDVTHYYLGTKYFPELGYTRLYPAIILADREGPRLLPKKGVQSYRRQPSYEVVPVDQVEAEAQAVHSAFSAQRWKQFEHDVAALIRMGGDTNWPRVLTDRGYNGTPINALVCSTLSRLCDAENVKWLCWIDRLVLIAACALVFWAYGTEAGLWSVLFLLISFSGRWPRYGESFLRMDWIAAMMASVCLLRKGRAGFAGMLLGYAAVVRVFPLLFLFAPVVRVGLAALRRAPDGPALRLVGGAACGSAVLAGLAALVYGPQSFVENARDLSIHQEVRNLSAQRVGFAVALGYRGELEDPETSRGGRWTLKERLVESVQPYAWAFALLIAILLARLAPRVPLDEGVILGMALVFFGTYASYYYMLMRGLLIMNHAANPGLRSNRAGLIWLLALEALSHANELLGTSRYALTAQLSVGLTIYFITVIGLRYAETAPALAGRPDRRRIGGAHFAAAVLVSAALVAWGLQRLESQQEPVTVPAAKPAGEQRPAQEAGNVEAANLQTYLQSTAYTSDDPHLTATSLPPPHLPIVDVHEHILGDAEARLLLDVMDELNIHHTCLMGTSRYTFTLDRRYGFENYLENNAAILDIARRYPGRFSAFVTLHPGDQGNLQRLQNYVAEGARGLKLYLGHGGSTGKGPFHLMPLDDPLMAPIYAYCQQVDLPIMLHVNLIKYYDEFIRLMDRFPQLRVCLPHFGLHKNSAERLSRLTALFEKYPNVYCDISFGWWEFHIEGFETIAESPNRFHDFLTRHADRFMFAADMVLEPTKDRAYVLDTLRSYRQILEMPLFRFFHRPLRPMHGLDLPESVLRQIYWDTPQRFLGLKLQESDARVKPHSEP